nr:MAG: RNA-dependent RNA polymerase [Porcine picobirnavirus]
MGEVHFVKHPMSLYYDIPNSNLRNYLKRQESGNTAIYETKFAEGQSISDLLGEWERHLQVLSSDWPSLLEYELDMMHKVGPLSYQRPLKERIPDLTAYYSLARDSKAVPDEAVEALLSAWPNLRNLRMRGQKQTLERMKLSTNSGAPYFTVKRRVVESLLPYSLEFDGDRTWIQHLPNWDGRLTATLGWRGQEGGPTVDDVKQRVLFMFPFVANLEELRVYQVLIEQCQKYGYVPPWLGNEATDAAITRLFATKDPKDLIVCTDFSKFDQHFGPAMQQAALRVLEGVFTHDAQFTEWVEKVYPIKYKIPLNYNWEWFATGEHGMGSGSGGTNGDETCGHKVLQYGVARAHGAGLNPNSMALGDDGVLSYPGITVADVVAYYTQFGLEMNPSKQYAKTDECIYLRRWHHKDYIVNGVNVGVYPTMRALGRLRYMERRFNTKGPVKKLFAMRQLSILNNCQYHPLGREFVKFCLSKDKYRLGYDIPGFFDRLDREYREAEAREELQSSYSNTFGNPSPPSEWWITKVIKELCA